MQWMHAAPRPSVTLPKGCATPTRMPLVTKHKHKSKGNPVPELPQTEGFAATSAAFRLAMECKAK